MYNIVVKWLTRWSVRECTTPSNINDNFHRLMHHILGYVYVDVLHCKLQFVAEYIYLYVFFKFYLFNFVILWQYKLTK